MAEEEVSFRQIFDLAIAQPVPMNINVGIPDQFPNTIAIQTSGPSGTHVAFLTPEAARKIGADLIQVAKRASSGLIVPPNGQIP